MKKFKADGNRINEALWGDKAGFEASMKRMTGSLNITHTGMK